QFIWYQLLEQVRIETFMKDLLKMPSQFDDQVMYLTRLQQS
ncbi:unnamed protein product, partial [Rotaria magnacalcarata]